MSPNDEPATKRDLAELEARLTEKIGEQKNELIQRMDEQKNDLIQRMDEQKNELVQRMDEQKNEIIEYMRDSETRLLKAFYGFMESNQTHMSQVDDTQAAFSKRLITLENRLAEVEKRLNMPPAA